MRLRDVLLSQALPAQRYFESRASRKHLLTLVNKACPWLRWTAREAYGEFYDLSDEAVKAAPRDAIGGYILQMHHFDAVDIGAIVAAVKRDGATEAAAQN
jgi:hypothetical protein